MIVRCRRTEGRLPRRSRLRAFGVLLGVIALVGLAACGTPSTPNRVVVLGLDGLDWAILDRMMKAGELPNFTRVVEGGVRAPLVSLEDFEKSPVIWTSMMTGRLPADHGILDFVTTDAETGLQIPVSSGERRVPAIWNMLGSVGRSVTVLGMWATYPAEPVGGTIVSDRFAFLASKPESAWNLSAAIEARLTFPPELFGALRGELDMDAWTLPLPIDRSLGRFIDLRRAEPPPLLRDVPDFHTDDVFYLRQTFQEDHLKHRVALRLLQEHPTDLMIHYFRGADVAEHFFWRSWEPDAFADVPGPAGFAEIIPDYYRYLDGILGDHLAALRRDDTLLIVSDHGQLAAPDIKGELYWSDVPSEERWRTRTETLFRALDLEWSDLGVMPGLRGVRYGEPWGKNGLTLSLDPTSSGRSLSSLRDEVIHRVLGMRLVPDGSPLFRLLEGDDPLRLRFEADIRKITYSTLVRVRGEQIPLRELFSTRQRSGDHRREGVFLGYGAGFRSASSIDAISVLDVTPLLLVLLDAPLGTSLPGEVPLQALDDATRRRALDQPEADYAATWERAGGDAMEDAEFVEQLRALGYVQ